MNYDYKTILRMPKELAFLLKKAAELKKWSLNTYIVYQLEKTVESKKNPKKGDKS